MIRFQLIGFGLGGYERLKFASSVAVTRSTTALLTRSRCYGRKWNEPAQEHYPDISWLAVFRYSMSQTMRGPSRSHSGPHGKSGPGRFFRYPLVLFMWRGFVTGFSIEAPSFGQPFIRCPMDSCRLRTRLELKVTPPWSCAGVELRTGGKH